MGKVRAHVYDAHLDYDVDIDVELLNMKIRIYGEEFAETGQVYYEGSVGKFIKERIPSDTLVAMLTELRFLDKVSYKLGTSVNFIERIR